MTDNTIAERQARLRASNAKRGLVQVKLWVPAGADAEKVKALATKLREKHLKSLK